MVTTPIHALHALPALPADNAPGAARHPTAEPTIGVLRLPRTIHAGVGARAGIPNLVAPLGSRVFIVVDPFLATTPHFAEVRSALESFGLTTAVYTEVLPELPADSLTAAAGVAASFAPDVVLGYGGGSALDAAKLVALLLVYPGPLSRYYGENQVPGPVVPLVAVPTTAGTGSEVTPVAVIADPERELKVGISSPYLIPTVAVVDPELSMAAPARVTAYSGIDALVHAVESYTAVSVPNDWSSTLPVFVGSNVLTAPFSLEAVRRIGPSLARAVNVEGDSEARIDMAYGSLAAGIAFGSTGTHLSHALQYPIGALTHTPHGLGTGMMLPFVLRACMPLIAPRLADIADALGVGSGSKSVEDRASAAIEFIDHLNIEIDLPRSLREIGIERQQLPRIGELAAGVKRLVGIAPAPDGASQEFLEQVLEAAYQGDPAVIVAPRLKLRSERSTLMTLEATPPASTSLATPSPYFSDLYINGRWRPGSDGRSFAVIDPSDGSEIAQFAAASEADCLEAVEAARAAMPAWAATPARQRSEILRRAFDILTAEREYFAEIMVRENGKSFADALSEATYATEFFRWFAEEAVRIPGDYRLSPNGDKRIVVTRQPIGVSLLITPWNFPAAMATRKLAPALAAGCTMILKPARETPLTPAYMVDVLERAGVPAGVVNLVTPVPTGPLVARMLAHPAVRKLSFTGSTEVGRELLHACADTVVSASMELGGNAPVIVLPGADLDQAVDGAVIAKMRNGGSACTAANRFYVHSSLHDDFAERMRAALASFSVGPGIDRSNTLGAMVSVAERDKVADLVAAAVSEGATIELGGQSLPRGAFYEPTLVTGVTHGSTINRTEIFGPVTAIVKFDDVDDAVRMANDTEFGLMAYVFGIEVEAMKVALRLEAGMVAVNRGVVSDPAAPFGGMKQSGLGREGSSEGILEFLEEKYIAINA